MKKQANLKFLGAPWITISSPVILAHQRSKPTFQQISNNGDNIQKNSHKISNQKSHPVFINRPNNQILTDDSDNQSLNSNESRSRSVRKFNNPQQINKMLSNGNDKFASAEEIVVDSAVYDYIEGVNMTERSSSFDTFRQIRHESLPEYASSRDKNNNFTYTTQPEKNKFVGSDELLPSTRENQDKKTISHHFSAGPIIKDEIQNGIWKYYNDTNDPYYQNNVQLDESQTINNNCLIHNNHSYSSFQTLKHSTVYGKKPRILERYSGAENESKSLNSKFYNGVLSEENRNKLKGSISAMRFAMFIKNNSRDMPDFLNGVEFDETLIRSQNSRMMLT